MAGWIGVDLDGTLAEYGQWKGPGHIGKPIKPMVDRVKGWLDSGETVKIFTARVSGADAEESRKYIEAWCEIHIGQVLEVTNSKDYGMVALYDDRAVQVIPNTGELVERKKD